MQLSCWKWNSKMSFCHLMVLQHHSIHLPWTRSCAAHRQRDPGSSWLDNAPPRVLPNRQHDQGATKQLDDALVWMDGGAKHHDQCWGSLLHRRAHSQRSRPALLCHQQCTLKATKIGVPWGPPPKNIILCCYLLCCYRMFSKPQTLTNISSNQPWQAIPSGFRVLHCWNSWRQRPWTSLRNCWWCLWLARVFGWSQHPLERSHHYPGHAVGEPLLSVHQAKRPEALQGQRPLSDPGTMGVDNEILWLPVSASLLELIWLCIAALSKSEKRPILLKPKPFWAMFADDEHAVCSPAVYALVQACLFWIDIADREGVQHQALRLERLERSRELCRNICNTVGVKPTTVLCAKWWQICTAAKLIHDSDAEVPDAFIPYFGMGPCQNKPITELATHPYIFIKSHFEETLKLLLDFFSDDCKFSKDFASVLEDLMHVANAKQAAPDKTK